MNKVNFYWEKLGIITNKLPKETWSVNYLQFPAAIVLNDKVRVFFSTRPPRESDGKNVTYIRYFDLNSSDLFQIIEFSSNPVIPLGDLGSFDQFGTMPGDFVFFDDKIYMFYTGWNRLEAVPYNFSVGLAISEDNGNTFLKYSKGPVISQSVYNPFTCGSGATILENGVFHMFLISGIEWKIINNKLEHTYGIRHAISNDGLHWEMQPDFAIYPKNEFEAIAAPTIIKIGSRYHMWFSYRGSFDFRNGFDSYRIGYAFSDDLFKWIRKDDFSGIQPSKAGWDSKMICYPYVFKLGSNIFMLYNGNSFGKNSIGLAKLKFESD